MDDADENPFLFSSEYLDSETNPVYRNCRCHPNWEDGRKGVAGGEVVDIGGSPGLRGGVVVLPLAK